MKLADYLDALAELKFAENTWVGYKATPAGEQALDAIGIQMVKRERFELKRRLEQLERLWEQLNKP